MASEFGAKDIVIKRGHFEAYGFFTLPSGKIWYFSLGDVRWDKNFLIRTAKSYNDYTGGSNNMIKIDSQESFVNALKNLLKE